VFFEHFHSTCGPIRSTWKSNNERYDTQIVVLDYVFVSSSLRTITDYPDKKC